MGADFRAYVLDDFPGQLTVLADELGGFPIVVILNPDDSFGLAYSAEIDGTVLEFRVEGEMIIDDEGTTWDIAGNAIAGPRAGTSLQFVNVVRDRVVWMGRLLPGYLDLRQVGGRSIHASVVRRIVEHSMRSGRIEACSICYLCTPTSRSDRHRIQPRKK